MTINQFSSGLESANFVLTSDPVHQAWNAIEKQKQINPNAEPCLFNEIQAENLIIIAFGTPPSFLSGQEALVSSTSLKEDNFAHFEFLCNKSNRSFSLNQAAVKLFQSQYPELLLLKEKLVVNSKSKTPPLVIITGHSVGGTVATLFTLWMLQGLNLSRTKRPICVTFGSPLVGDENLRKCVLKFSTWNSCFLHIVSNQDPTLQLFISRNPGAYKPFGTFLLCSGLGCACFEDPDIILEQLVKTNSQNQECHYGLILGDLKCKALCNVSVSTDAKIDSQQASLITQLQAIGILSQQQPSKEIDSLIVKMKKHETKLLIQKKKKWDSDKKLYEMKVHMAYLECYKKESRQHKIGGYYDRYRNQGNITDVSVNEFKKKLMNYWEDSVTEVENKPQMEGVHFQVRWLWGGTNYRRMVEPLHIAEYYRDGGKNYKTEGKRPKQFILLEEWIKEVVKPEATPIKSKRESVGSSLNEDSCFWADVEEARISCDLVKNGSVGEKERALQELKKFEADVYASLKNYALSPEIFLEKSSFMQWLKEYKGVVKQPYSSLLLDFMKERNYEAYKEGKFMQWKEYKGVVDQSCSSLQLELKKRKDYWPTRENLKRVKQRAGENLGMKNQPTAAEVMWGKQQAGENLGMKNQQTRENLKREKQQAGENLEMKNQQTRENLKREKQFSGDLELANFIVTSGAIHQAWAAIEEQEEINPDAELSSYNEILKSNPTIISFGTPRSSLQGKEGLISSSALKEDDVSHFEFLCSKSTPCFSINESAINIFRSNYHDLNLLGNKLVQISSHSSSIIITGRSVGGCVAILFTLWLLDGFNLSKTRHPLCITFGSPLLGDECLQQCVSELSTWKSFFLHIASDQDPIPKFFLSQNPSTTYKPFGTFLLCSASGFTCVEEPDSILEWLVTATPQSSHSQDSEQFFDYGEILEDLEVSPLCKDKMEVVEGEINPFQAMSQGKNVSNSFKKLSEVQCDMAILEWHKKEAKIKKIGLYDMYKKLLNTSDIVVLDSIAEEEFKPHEGGGFFWKKLLNISDMVFPDYKKLMRYWEVSVAEEEFKPHKEGDFFWDRWLLAGTSYRRMVEPLLIAEYYKKDARNYITDGRPRHFILLEQWWNEREKPEASQNNAWIKRQVAASRLNADSCFWAHVEEAIISCKLLVDDDEDYVRDRESSKLIEFEGYVYDAINKNEVSLDIFLEGSSFRQWWNMYEAIMGSSYCSSLMRKFWEGMKTLTNPNEEEEDGILAGLRSANVTEIEVALTSLSREDAPAHLCSPRVLSALSALVVSSYTNIQVNSLAALVILSKEKSNKIKILLSGIILPLIDVLKAGSPDAQKHASGLVFSLALDDDCKMDIGVLGALPSLLHLLKSESEQTRNNSASALYHLTLVQSNRAELLKLGAVPVLLSRVGSGHMAGWVLLILCNLCSCLDGRVAMLDSGGVGCLVGVLRGNELDSRLTQENCVATLYGLSHHGSRFKGLAEAAGAREVLKEVVKSGSERARERARRMLEMMEDRRHEVDLEKLLDS